MFQNVNQRCYSDGEALKLTNILMKSFPLDDPHYISPQVGIEDMYNAQNACNITSSATLCKY